MFVEPARGGRGQGQQSILVMRSNLAKGYCFRARCGHYKWTLQQDAALSHTVKMSLIEPNIVTTKQPRSESSRLCAVWEALEEMV